MPASWVQSSSCTMLSQTLEVEALAPASPANQWKRAATLANGTLSCPSPDHKVAGLGHGSEPSAVASLHFMVAALAESSQSHEHFLPLAPRIFGQDPPSFECLGWVDGYAPSPGSPAGSPGR